MNFLVLGFLRYLEFSLSFLSFFHFFSVLDIYIYFIIVICSFLVFIPFKFIIFLVGVYHMKNNYHRDPIEVHIFIIRSLLLIPKVQLFVFFF